MSAPTTTRLDVNVLVIGGGFGGTWAALRAGENISGVLLVDKATVARSGASTMSGGVTTAPRRSDDLHRWAEEFIVLGGYEANQDWTFALLEDQIERIDELDSWGVPIVKDENGAIVRIKSRGMVDVRCLQYSPREAMETLRKKCLDVGVTILDKVAIVELLTSDGAYPTKGAVVGAIGIDVRDAQRYEIHAKRTILATGPHAMKGYHPIDNITGDGYALGYRVGGRFVNMEFSPAGTFSFAWAGYHMGNFNVAVGHGAKLLNAQGERFMERYDPVRFERGELNRVVAAFVKEILDGRGPVYLDVTGVDETYWEAVNRARGGKKHVLQSDAIPDPRRFPVLIEPGWSFWNGGQGGLQIDLECHTNVPGLFAVGNVARNDAVGRHSSAGTPTAHAMVSGARAGIAAAREALGDETPTAPADVVERLLRDAVAPLQTSGASTDGLYAELIDIMGSPLELLVQNEAKLRRALQRVADLSSRLGSVTVSDVHELVKLHEARNNLDTFELIFSCMLDRTESRENFYREDFPLQDDETWLCWHRAWRGSGGVEIERQEIPFDRFEFRPDRREVKVSSTAAILRGDFEPNNYENIYEERAGAR